MSWTQQHAIELCKRIESVCPRYGCHVALTGGLLYKDGPRKDCDILFYRIRQCGDIDDDGLLQELDALGILKKVSGFGWCIKAVCEQGNVDCFFPEELSGAYPTQIVDTIFQ